MATVASTPLVYDPGVTTNLTEIAAAQNAEVVIEGFTVQSTTNTISEAIDGVTLKLCRQSPARPCQS